MEASLVPLGRRTLYVGVITSDPVTLCPLLVDLSRLSIGSTRLVTVVLDNASDEAEMTRIVAGARGGGLDVVVISHDQQRRDAARGCFGTTVPGRPPGKLAIAAARTILQRYLGAWMASDHDAFAWLLDDDMRVDARALGYLPLLGRFRDAGVDVLIGALEGASPNPPLHGIQGQLFDLVRNLSWLGSLPASSILPDRSAENAASRERFPDYYYDLSRKHSRHLETVFWLEPSFAGETVGAAYERLLEGAPGIPWGLTLTRGLIAAVPTDPFEAARDSVNRGGNTFVLSHRALTSTPNSCLRAGGGEMRRSDMVWAIVNRHYRRMTIKQVDFPVVHVGQRGDVRRLDTAKVAGEVVGSAIYRALTEFLGNQPAHELDFACDESAAIGARAQHHRAERLGALAASFARIASLRSELRAVAHRRELEALDVVLDGWITPQVLAEVSSLARAVDRRAVEAFVSSLRGEADALDTAPLVDIAPLVASLYAGSSR